MQRNAKICRPMACRIHHPKPLHTQRKRAPYVEGFSTSTCGNLNAHPPRGCTNSHRYLWEPLATAQNPTGTCGQCFQALPKTSQNGFKVPLPQIPQVLPPRRLQVGEKASGTSKIAELSSQLGSWAPRSPQAASRPPLDKPKTTEDSSKTT